MMISNKQSYISIEKYKDLVNFHKNDIGLDSIKAVIYSKDIILKIIDLNTNDDQDDQDFIKVVNVEGEDVFIHRYAIDGFTMSVNKTHDRKELVIFLGYNHFIICPEDQYKSLCDQLGVNYEEDN